MHGKLPTAAELKAYKAKLDSLRGLPEPVKEILERIPAASHPMDVMRTGVSALGTVLPERDDHAGPGARDIADRLMASMGSMLLYWYHWSHNGKRIDVETDDDSIGGHFLHLLHGRIPKPLWVEAMHTSLILYAEHEFNASTFAARVIAGTGSDFHSCIAGAIGALRGPKHGGANEVSFEIQKRYDTGDEAEADMRERVEAKEVVIGFGHPVYTIADPRNKVIKEIARNLSRDADSLKMFGIAERIETVMVDAKRMFANLDWYLGGLVSHDGRADGDVHAAVRDLADIRLVGACHRAADRRQDHPALRQLHRPGEPEVRPDRPDENRSGPPPCPPTSATSARSPTAFSSTSPTTSPSTRSRARKPRHRAPLPDRHAGLRLRGALLSRVHEADGTDRSRDRRSQWRQGAGHVRSSSIRYRLRSTSGR